MAICGCIARMLVNAPLIAKLFARPRLWANRRIASGRYGSISRHAGSDWVKLDDVEAAEGTKFTPERLAAAGLHLDDFEEV
jgi:hypothetical protein